MRKRPIKSFVKKSPNYDERVKLAKQLKELIPNTTDLLIQITDLLIQGCWNGYAILPPGHPLYGVKMTHIDLKDFDRPITFASYVRDICWPEVRLEEKDGYVIGFDTMLNGDTSHNCTEKYVRREIQKLVDVLEAMW